jgi:anthranilate synthase component 1
VGYLNHDGSMDLNILIRTLVRNHQRVELRAGAGIVADSDWQHEAAGDACQGRGLLHALGVRA